MIIVKFSGGLGNQFFQYTFGKYLSVLLNTQVKFYFHHSIDNPIITRKLDILNFDVELDFANEEDIKNYKYFNKMGYLFRVERKLTQKFPFINKKFFVEFPFDIIKNETFRNNCYYDGYWQSKHYFNAIKDILIREFCLKEIDEGLEEIADQINATTSISLHIRRGDYVSIKSNSKIYNICSLDYYLGAIKTFEDKFENSIFYVFSDDIEWSKRFLKGFRIKYIDKNYNNPSADLYLMSQCKHNIIANSTFSWWASVLNAYKDKIVFAPNRWYKDDFLNERAKRCLIYQNWLTA